MPIKFLTLALLVAAFAVPAYAGEKATKIRVDGMTCPFCVATSEKALKGIEGVTSVTTDLEAGVITVCANDKAELSDDILKSLFLEKGFTFVSAEQFETCKDS